MIAGSGKQKRIGISDGSADPVASLPVCPVSSSLKSTPVRRRTRAQAQRARARTRAGDEEGDTEAVG